MTGRGRTARSPPPGTRHSFLGRRRAGSLDLRCRPLSLWGGVVIGDLDEGPRCGVTPGGLETGAALPLGPSPRRPWPSPRRPQAPPRPPPVQASGLLGPLQPPSGVKVGAARASASLALAAPRATAAAAAAAHSVAVFSVSPTEALAPILSALWGARVGHLSLRFYLPRVTGKS